MGNSKEIAKFIKKIFSFEYLFVFLFLCLLPFGQLGRFNIHLGEITVPFLLSDAAVGLGALYTVIFQKKTKIFKYVMFFILACFFSFVLSYFYFGTKIIYGSFYLLRVSVYLIFANYVFNYIKSMEKRRKLLLDSLVIISTISAVFGWIQMAVLPDLKILYYIGWDMHLFRLAGTFFDPTFLGLIIVFGLITSMYRYIEVKKTSYIPLILFLLISLAFTYARACYLAFVAGVLVLAIIKKKIKWVFVTIVGLAFIALLLPTSGNLSNKLTRTFSISARFQNYSEALTIFKKYPVFGVGYNNFCVAKNLYIGEEEFSSHACSGADSSLLLILATTGIVGLLVFAGTFIKIAPLISKNRYGVIFISCVAAVFIHSLFSNSLFYPLILGFLIVLLGTSLKE